MSKWSHLPNAAHIDRVLASVKANPKIWADVSNAVPDAAHNAAWYAILALIAYDDAAKYLDLPLDQLKMLYALTEHPAALLLQTAVLAFSIERELAST